DTAGRLGTITQGAEVYTYGYDILSRRTNLGRPNGVTTSYAWDQVDRLSRLTHTNAGGVALEDFQYGYNLDDEITSINSLASASKLPTGKTATAADAANRISQFGNASYGFDSIGQTTTKTDGNGTTRYNWDARGRLTGVTLPNQQTVNYGYDALGRRASRTAGSTTTRFLYDGSDVVLDRAGSDVTDYLHGAAVDEHLRQGSVSAGQYFLQDHIASTAALTNTSGGGLERKSYEPFGGGGTGSLNRSYYHGRGEEPTTNLLHYRNREYDAEQGRFLTEDPAGLSAGLNRYSYVANDPLGFNDPFGLSLGTFLSGLRDGVFSAVASTLVAAAILAGLSAVGISTGGTAFAAIGAILTAYGLYSLLEQIESIARNWNDCPDERDYQLGQLVGEALGSLLGGAAAKAATREVRPAGARRPQRGAEPCPYCFAAGTEVELTDGSGKPIETVQVDDVVLSAEEVAALDTRGDKEPKPGHGKVSRLFSRIAPAVLDVSVGESEKITVTSDHEFWVMGEGWKSARELWVGAKLLTKSGKIVTVENIRR